MSLEHLVSEEELAELCNKDGEFGIASRFWSGGLRLVMGEKELAISIEDGVASAAPARA